MKKVRRKTISCGAVVYRVEPDQTISLLLIKQFKHKDSWGIPKGRLNKDESLVECAIREVKEETGVAVKLGERLPDCTIHLKNEAKTIVSYLARPIDPSAEPTHDDPDNEVADARWIPIDRLPKIHVYQQKLIAATTERLQLSLGLAEPNVN